MDAIQRWVAPIKRNGDIMEWGGFKYRARQDDPGLDGNSYTELVASFRLYGWSFRFPVDYGDTEINLARVCANIDPKSDEQFLLLVRQLDAAVIDFVKRVSHEMNLLLSMFGHELVMLDEKNAVLAKYNQVVSVSPEEKCC